MNRIIFVLLAVAVLAVKSAAAPADTNALTFEGVLRLTFARNPALLAARAAAGAMEARVPQARAWDDPRVGVDVERSGTTRLTDWSDAEWMVSQAIPINAKNRVRGRAATAEAGAAQAAVQQLEIELAARARSSLARLANIHRQLAINGEIETLLNQLLEVSRSRYAAGTGMQSDALMAEGDVVRLLEARQDLERRATDEQTALNLLMNFPPQSPLGAPARNAYVELDLPLDALQAAARAARPDLRGVGLRRDAAAARVELAKRQWIPDPELRVEARQFHGAGGFIQEYDTGIFFSVPWLNQGKYRGAIAEARQTQEAAERELEAADLQIAGAVRDQLRRVETFRLNFTLFRDRLVPLARQTADAARIAYVNGQGRFLDVMTALRTLSDVAAVHENHLTDYLVALAELEGIVGRPLASLVPATTATPPAP